MKEVLSGIEYIYIYPPVGDARVAKSSMIEVLFDKISGSFATAGPIYVYQYEYEEETTEMASGPMASGSQPLSNSAITIFPNPFTERLDIRFQVPDNNIRLKIYDACGRLVRRFNHLSATQYGGNSPSNQIVWNGTDETGKALSNGIYFVVLETGKDRMTQKLILLR